MDTLYLDLPSTAGNVNVHPLVLLSVLDHHIRRDAQQDRVIGALLGTVINGVVEVTDAFGVHHSLKEDEVKLRLGTLKEMLKNHQRVDPTERLVGWYSTWVGDEGPASREGLGGRPQKTTSERDFTKAVHDFFEGLATDVRPVYLLVDVSLRTPHVHVHAQRQTHNALLKRLDLTQYSRLHVNLVATAEERVGLDAMARAANLRDGGGGAAAAAGAGGSAPGMLGEARDLAPDAAALEASLRRLRKLLETVSRYCDEVARGAREGDEAVGRAISDTLAAVPPFEADHFQRTFGRSVQDLLMVAYLASLTQAQIKLAERISLLPTQASSS